jgi:hypothetical protein
VVEQRFCKPLVGSSNLSAGTKSTSANIRLRLRAHKNPVFLRLYITQESLCFR